jgi:hypothetical protein
MRRSRAFVALVLILPLAACTGAAGPGYQRTNRTVEIEPGTGDTIITQYWKIGSRTTSTYKRIPRGNTDTRGEPEPPVAPDRED